MGINIDTEYGGRGLSEIEAVVLAEEVGKVCPDTAGLLSTQQFVAPQAIETLGSQSAKEKYLPPVTNGDSAVAISISEPQAGSDVSAIETTITGGNGEMEINGEKIWTSHFEVADAAVVWAKFSEGLGAVVVDLTKPGVEVQERYTNMAGQLQVHYRLKNVPVDKDDILVSGEDDMSHVLKALNWERIASATFANSVAHCSLEFALDHAENREQFGQPIIDFQGIEWKLSDMTKELEEARALTHQVVREASEQNREPSRLDASMAKLSAVEMVEDVVSESLQIHGAEGYQRGHPLEYLYRLARGRKIAGGTSEIQRNTIANVVKSEGIPEQ